MAVYTHHLPAWKKDEVAAIKKHAKEDTLIGLVDMYGIPAQQVQQIREISGKAVIKVTRNTLIEHALGEIGGDAKGLTKFISGHSAVIFSNDNPFKLFKQLEKTKTKMAAKAGEYRTRGHRYRERSHELQARPDCRRAPAGRAFPRQSKAARSRSGRPRPSSKKARSYRRNLPMCSSSLTSSPWTWGSPSRQPSTMARSTSRPSSP